MNNSKTAWACVALARHSNRPRTKDIIELICDDFIELHGDRYYKDDPAIIGGIGIIKESPVTIIGHQKGKDTEENIKRNFGMAHPEGYRKALRLMKQAEKFNRPIINFIDTPGAYCGLEAEERGQSEAIARNLFEMMDLEVPILSIIIGEGGSGGALGLAVANDVWMLEHSIYSVISPEGFSSILLKDSAKAKEASEMMKITPGDLLNLGLIDEVIKEPDEGAHLNYELLGITLKEKIIAQMAAYSNIKKEELSRLRREKFRNYGHFKDNNLKV
ncbi:MAG TPA: acetyl-CoA carboxylase carboxyltransferase subunit alpha [Clostridia bacterium]|nr:acetyl-CoA carboxylase carboxyltransferase subunit alpha [Clostridia bacterium]